MANINQRLNGLNPLAYVGVNAVQPPDFLTKNRPPTPNDSKNVYLGQIWLDYGTNTPPTTNDIYMLVSLDGNMATWVSFGGGDLETLTGNSGGAVSPDGSNNINIVGTGVITVVGNTVTNTLTITPSSSIASSFITSPATGTATPASGVLTFAGTGATTVSASGSTITINSVDTGTTSFVTDSLTATPAAGVLNIKAQTATLGCGSSVKFTAPGSSNTVQFDVTDADANTMIGSESGRLAMTSSFTTALGYQSGSDLTTANHNTMLGYQAGTALTTGGNNVFVGSGSGSTLIGTTDSIIIGYQAGTGVGLQNSGHTVMGYVGPSVNPTGGGYIAIGVGGVERFFHNFPGSGSGNVFVGFDTGTESSLQGLNSDNTCIGQHSLSALTSGEDNTCLGYQSGNLITTGNGNTLVGRDSGSNYTSSESNNICIGFGVLGTIGESNVARIGNIRGATTAVADAIAVLIDSTGQLGTVSSSKRYKENIVDMGSYSDPIRKLRPVVFNYKKHSPESKSVGLIAEEAAEVFPDIVVYDKDGFPETIKYHDLVPMLLNEFKIHCKLIADQQAIIADLMNRVRLLEEHMIKKSCH